MQVEHQVHPEEWPNEEFELIVFSELGYNFPPAELRELVPRLCETLSPSGTLVACHWRYDIVGCVINGDDVHRTIGELMSARPIVRQDEADFLLEIWSGGSRSVAAREGMR